MRPQKQKLEGFSTPDQHHQVPNELQTGQGLDNVLGEFQKNPTTERYWNILSDLSAG